MFKNLINKIKKKFTIEVEVIPPWLRENFYDYTWGESLNEILFFTGENSNDFIAYTSDADLEEDIAHKINFVAYTSNFIYYAHYDNTDDEEEISGFKLIPLSQYGYDFLEGNISKTIH